MVALFRESRIAKDGQVRDVMRGFGLCTPDSDADGGHRLPLGKGGDIIAVRSAQRVAPSPLAERLS